MKVVASGERKVNDIWDKEFRGPKLFHHVYFFYYQQQNKKKDLEDADNLD